MVLLLHPVYTAVEDGSTVTLEKLRLQTSPYLVGVCSKVAQHGVRLACVCAHVCVCVCVWMCVCVCVALLLMRSQPISMPLLHRLGGHRAANDSVKQLDALRAGASGWALQLLLSLTWHPYSPKLPPSALQAVLSAQCKPPLFLAHLNRCGRTQ